MRTAPTAQICTTDPDHGGFITVVWDGQPYTIRSEEDGFAKALEALKHQNWNQLWSLLNPSDAFVESYKHENVAIINGQVTYKGQLIHNTVCKRILNFLAQGLDCKHLFAFLENLMLNPSYTSVEELYLFLENKNIPITDKGTFYAYKSVRSDYTDHHTGRFSNKPGTKNSMDRNLVDDNRRRHCSSGFHVGSLEYASAFGGYDKKIVICEINPKDAVSVPEDHECQKLRVSDYTVIGDYTGPLVKPVYRSNSLEDFDDSLEDFEDNESDEDASLDVNGDTLVDGMIYRDSFGDFYRYNDSEGIFVNVSDEDDSFYVSYGINDMTLCVPQSEDEADGDTLEMAYESWNSQV